MDHRSALEAAGASLWAGRFGLSTGKGEAVPAAEAQALASGRLSALAAQLEELAVAAEAGKQVILALPRFCGRIRCEGG